MSKLDEFIKDSSEMVGKEVTESPLVNSHTTYKSMSLFTTALGEENPLYLDPTYCAEFTRYDVFIAEPMYLAAIRTPVAFGAEVKKDYDLADLFSGAEFEWFDVIRCGDIYTTDLKLTKVTEGTVESRQVAYLTAEGSYWKQHKELVGKGSGTMVMIPLEKRGETMLTKRTMHVYSDDDVARVEKGIASEVIRGVNPLYWDDVNVGDELPPVVKGPLGLSELFQWRVATRVANFALDRAIKYAKNNPGLRRVNPYTNWPYFSSDLVYEDNFTCQLQGMPLPFDFPVQRVALVQHLLTNWMSDEGFLRRLKVNTPLPYLYGDTIWFNGQVTKKYKVKENEVEYMAVDVKIEGVNQLNAMTTTGEATIYLPSPCQEVILPIPH